MPRIPLLTPHWPVPFSLPQVAILATIVTHRAFCKSTYSRPELRTAFRFSFFLSCYRSDSRAVLRFSSSIFLNPASRPTNWQPIVHRRAIREPSFSFYPAYSLDCWTVFRNSFCLSCCRLDTRPVFRIPYSSFLSPASRTLKLRSVIHHVFFSRSCHVSTFYTHPSRPTGSKCRL